jgi:hypothetical protein
MTSLTPFGPAVHGELLGFGAELFPTSAVVVFQSPEGRLLDRLRPDLLRPHWLVLGTLPTSLPVGESQVFVEGDRGWRSTRVALHVAAAGASPTRVLYPGRAVERPFTIAFVANPAIRTTSGAIIPDPVLTQLPRFAETVVASLKALLTREEDLLRREGLERLIRFVIVCDPSAPATEQNALALEYAHFPVMRPRRLAVPDFLRRHGVAADVAFVIHGSRTHRMASAQFTTDDRAGRQLEYTYDRAKRVHGLYPDIPGSVALSIYLSHDWPIALHEFAHAVSECHTGRVIDAYVDGGDERQIIVNKKYRKRLGLRVPDQFCEYGLGGEPPARYASDGRRDGLGYPETWTSFHPELLDPHTPNLLDDYRRASVDPKDCRFDRLTHRWLWDRIWAKAHR